MKDTYRILCINPGSTSTKLALFLNGEKLDESNLEHSEEELSGFHDIISQLPMRKAAINAYLEKHGLKPGDIDAIAARGCPANHRYHGGAYAIDADIVDACMQPANAVHPMCLAPVIAYEWVKEFGTPAYTYDVVMTDELKDIARYTSLPNIKRVSIAHMLNTKAVAREVAEEMGTSYDQVNFIMCHLGGGVSVSMHEHGRVTDMVSNGEGGFAPSRAGSFANITLIKMCYSGKYTEKELRDILQHRCGLIAYVGTGDCRKVESMIAEGNETAKMIYEVMAYNLAKDIGTLSVTTCGKVDRIVLTGGIAYSKMFTDMIAERVKFIAPVVVRPGAIEMEALARGILRVLRGEEEVHRYADPY